MNCFQFLFLLLNDTFAFAPHTNVYNCASFEFSPSSKQTAIEIEQLNARVVEAETKLKTEVARIKKKLQIQITELEMSLDVANKTNLDLQKVCKKQSLQLTELQSHYDDVQRQLQQTLDQYGVAQRRIQSITAELEEIRANYENALRSKRNVELSLEDAQTRINELSVINANLASTKSKLEIEIAQVAQDYEEITRELRISDERYQKVQVSAAAVATIDGHFFVPQTTQLCHSYSFRCFLNRFSLFLN